MQHELYFHFWFLSERQTWLLTPWVLWLNLKHSQGNWMAGWCLLYWKKDSEGEWEAPSVVLNVCGFRKKGCCELIWVKLPHKLCIFFKNFSMMSVYDLKGNIRKESLGWTDVIKPLYYVSHLADFYWRQKWHVLAKNSGWCNWGWKEVFIGMCASFCPSAFPAVLHVISQLYLLNTHMRSEELSIINFSIANLHHSSGVLAQCPKKPNQANQKSGKELRRVGRALWVFFQCFPAIFTVVCRTVLPCPSSCCCMSAAVPLMQC